MTGLVCALGANAAHAEDEVEPIRVVYQAPDECPSDVAFVDEIRARTNRATVVTSGERRVFTVHVTATKGRTRGTLVIAAGERASQRNVEGRTCAEVTSALALIAALAVDPHASTKPVVELAAPPPPPPSSPETPPPPIEPTSPPAIDTLPTEPPRTHDVVIGAPRWSLGVEADGELRSGVTPRGAPAFGGGVVLERDRTGLFAPHLRLSGRAAPAQTEDVGAVSAQFALAAARLEGCPVRLTLARGLSGRPCALAEAGVLSAQGEHLARGQSTARSWFGAGASLRTSWQLSHIVFVDGGITAIVPLRRDRFYAGPGTTFFEVPVVGFGVGLGLGVLLFS